MTKVQPSEIVSNLGRLPNWVRRNRVVTVTPDVQRSVQTAAIAIFNKRPPYWDGTVIAPKSANLSDLPYAEVHLGQLILTKTPGFDSDQTVEVTVTNTNPALVLLANSDFLSYPLYGKLGERGSEQPEYKAAILKRVILFNRAVAQLIMEAEIETPILHLYDWPTTLTLLYLEQENISVRKCLFTYPDACYQGLFPVNLVPWLGLTGNRPTDLQDYKYYNQISLAQLGMQRASRILTLHRQHLDEVKNNYRPGGGDYGEFTRYFKARHAQGELDYLSPDTYSAEQFAMINMLSPKPKETKLIRTALSIYRHEYTRLEPWLPSDSIPDEVLYEAAERKDLSPFTLYAQVRRRLEGDNLLKVIQPFSMLVKRFGSQAAIDPVLHRSKPRRKKFMESLQGLLIDWSFFLTVATNTFNETPKRFDQLSPCEAGPVLGASKEVKAAGRQALQGPNGGPFSDLLIVTLSGGLAQRLRFRSQISYDLIIKESDLTREEIDCLTKQAETGQIRLRFCRDEEAVWYIPWNYVPGNIREKAQPQGSLLLRQTIIKIPQQVLSGEANAFLKDRGAISGEGLKQEETWLLTKNEFYRLREFLMKNDHDDFHRNLIDEIYQQLKGKTSADDPLFISLPKGLYTLPGATQSIFEMIAHSIARLSTMIGKKVVWGVMVSNDNKVLIQEYFKIKLQDNKYFGLLDADQVIFATQGDNPIIAVKDVKEAKNKLDIVVGSDGRIVAEANGHGGFYESADCMLTELQQRDHRPNFVLAANIDNLLLGWQLGNLDFVAGWLGHHVNNEYDITCLASKKRQPKEEMGIFALTEDGPRVIEYYHPNYTARNAYAYNSSSRGRLYFVKDNEKDLFLVVPETALGRIASWVTPALDGILFPKTKKTLDEPTAEPRKRYQLLELQELPDEVKLQSVSTDDSCGPTEKTSTLADLGKVKMTYSQGNTNAFIFNSSFVTLVANNPTIRHDEPHKLGKHPLGYKIESELSGPIRLIRQFEFRLGKPIPIGFVEEERQSCFEPLKTPEDLDNVSLARDKLLECFLKPKG